MCCHLLPPPCLPEATPSQQPEVQRAWLVQSPNASLLQCRAPWSRVGSGSRVAEYAQHGLCDPKQTVLLASTNFFFFKHKTCTITVLSTKDGTSGIRFSSWGDRSRSSQGRFLGGGGNVRWGSEERCEKGWECFLHWSRLPLSNGTWTGTRRTARSCFRSIPGTLGTSHGRKHPSDHSCLTPHYFSPHPGGYTCLTARVLSGIQPASSDSSVKIHGTSCWIGAIQVIKHDPCSQGAHILCRTDMYKIMKTCL